MLNYLFEKLGKLIERASNAHHDTYLASATDLADLERRMRALECEGASCARERA